MGCNDIMRLGSHICFIGAQYLCEFVNTVLVLAPTSVGSFAIILLATDFLMRLALVSHSSQLAL